MAELRCPMCSKMNPDTLEVCQFCGARLKPLVRPPTGGLTGATDWGQPSAAPTPAADDWFSSLQSGGEPGVEKPAAGGGVDDWLSRLRAQDEAEETTPITPVAPAAPTPAPAPTPVAQPLIKPKAGGTDWLGALRASTDQLPSWLAEPVEPSDATLDSIVDPSDETWASQPKAVQPPVNDNLPSWLSDPADVAVPESDETIYTPGPINQAPAADLPSWMSAASNEPSAPAPASSAGSSPLPDWLNSYSGSSDETIVRGPATPPPPPEPVDWRTGFSSANDETQVSPPVTPEPEPEAEPESQLPAWMTGGTDDVESSASSLPEWMRSGGPDDTIAAAPSEIPDWLKSEMSTLPAESTAPEPAPEAAPGLPGWLDEAYATSTASTSTDDETIAVGPDEIPDWLKSEAPAAPVEPAAPEPVAAPPVAESAQPKSVVGITDWFASEDSTAPGKKPATGTSDWLKSPDQAAPPLNVDDPTTKKSVVGVTDWLSSFQGQSSDEDLDWLKPPEPAAPAAPTTPAPGTTEWLNAMGVTTPSKPSTGELRNRGTGWLGSAPDAPKPPDADAPRVKVKPGTDNLDWLKDTSPPPAEMPSGSAPAISGLTGWLSNLQNTDAPPTNPIAPAAPDSSGKAVVGTTDWLASLSGEKKSSGKTGWLGALPPTQTPEPSQEESSKALLGSTDWLSQLAASAPTGEPTFEMPSAEPEPVVPLKTDGSDWLPPAPSESIQDWTPPGSTDQLPQITPTATPTASSSGKAVVGTTDWLAEMEAKGQGMDLSAPSTRKNDVSDLDWLNIGPATSAAPATPAAPIEPAAAPRASTPSSPINLPPSPSPFSETVQTGELPGWLAALRPDGMEAHSTSIPVPGGKSTSGPAMASEDLPEWIRPGTNDGPSVGPSDETFVAHPRKSPASATSSSIPAFVTPTSGDLTAANVPSWLNALRPLDARATAREPEPDHEEATGPLAGMRGVLPAESIISMAGRPGVSITGFELTDIHTKLAENLRRLVQEEVTEDAEVKPRKRTRINFSFSRLIVALLMLFVIAIPFAAGPFLFPVPAPTAATNALYQQVEQLPATGSVVLLAVDYDPAFSGEMNPIVSSVLVHLLKKGAHVITVSTNPSGAGIAQKLLADAAFEADLANDAEGKDYINLGYIPGNLAGLRQFASDPLRTVTADYNGNTNPFSRDVLVGFNGLNNVNMIIVATASADTMRSWVEQVGNQGRPMAGITSASAAPLVAPYAFGKTPQLSALITGLAGGLEYNTLTGRISGSAEYAKIQWTAFGLSLYATAAILGAGVLMSLIALVLGRRPKTVKAPANAKAKAKPAAKRKAAPVVEDISTAAEPDYAPSIYEDSGTSIEPSYSESEPGSFGLETVTVVSQKKTTATKAKTSTNTKAASNTKAANSAKTTKNTKAPAKPAAKPAPKTNGASDDTNTKPKMRKV